MLPNSFLREGFQTPDRLRTGKKRRLLIGCEGPADSGKTEFALSAPGPGVAVCLDRGIDPVFDNPNPPPTRQKDWGFKVISAPLQTSAKQEDYLSYWHAFKGEVYKAIAIPECRAVLIDGDSDSWELQRLAEFGTLSQIPSIKYTTVNAARRAFYAKLWDSGKIIIATNKVKKLYKVVIDPITGEPKKGNDGKPLREWDGESWERQGFDDQEYLWQIQLRHSYDSEKGWGITIIKCKADRGMEGQSFWGDECNFQTLVQSVYPAVPLSEWGY